MSDHHGQVTSKLSVYKFNSNTRKDLLTDALTGDCTPFWLPYVFVLGTDAWDVWLFGTAAIIGLENVCVEVGGEKKGTVGFKIAEAEECCVEVVEKIELLKGFKPTGLLSNPDELVAGRIVAGSSGCRILDDVEAPVDSTGEITLGTAPGVVLKDDAGEIRSLEIGWK